MKYEIKETEMTNWTTGEKEKRFLIEVSPSIKLNFDSMFEAVQGLAALKYVAELERLDGST